ncbi:MAG: DUF2470 domain-containing protein [Pseudomonadota bacterium]
MNKNLLQPVDEEVRRQAKALLRTARYAALAALDARDGAPTVSRVALATDMMGRPVFLMSRLSGHFQALEADPRCALLFGEPGEKGDPLSHPRITVGGHAQILQDGPARDHFRNRFLAKNPKAQLYVDFPDMAFWRLTPDRMSFNGGFGKAYDAGPADLLSTPSEALAGVEAGVVAHMNEDHADAVDKYAAQQGATRTGWKLACVDAEGIDLIRAGETLRVWFEAPVADLGQLKDVLVRMARA